MRKRKKSKLLEDKLLYTYLIVLAYMIGRSIPLFGVDTSNLVLVEFDAQSILTQTVSGDLNQCSIFALGITPYMIAAIPVMMIAACRSSESKARTSQITLNRITVYIILVVAILLAIARVGSLPFTGQGMELILQKTVASVQMVTGAFVIMWMARRNKKYGIGGQTALIYINILDGIRVNLSKHSLSDVKSVVMFAIVGILVILFMENTEKRIPVQRISIHNIYADKNYYAIKFLPIGIMPIMFSSAVYALPGLVVTLLLRLFPNSNGLIWFQANNDLTKPLGIGIYLGILFLLTVLFALMFINPGESAEQFLKSGDSIVNLHAGKDTKWYLFRQVVWISIFSAVIMGACVGIPMLLQLTGRFDNSLVMLPTSIMMLTGIWTTLYQEMEGVKNLDSYEKFISVSE